MAGGRLGDIYGHRHVLLFGMTQQRPGYYSAMAMAGIGLFISLFLQTQGGHGEQQQAQHVDERQETTSDRTQMEKSLMDDRDGPPGNEAENKGDKVDCTDNVTADS
ncbi:hypothetical protein QBC46DRAFT_412213 [Diplogelasinospora grovesii]|uniref:Uncharacterized protein n=1 Tax=Diplogelasinospora grovesii TaxID=303347 RepID=A0AAN6N2P2_9PEZI|nr:hypothetical protein QBC46DRAFT_412213 [Diplogelasinospora grovesii]